MKESSLSHGKDLWKDGAIKKEFMEYQIVPRIAFLTS